jgi:hypothetical protein
MYPCGVLRPLFPFVVVALALIACAPTAFVATPVQGANGRLDASDSRLDSGEFYETFNYAGTAGGLLTITLTSTEIDPYLIVLDPDGERIAEIDDSPGHGHNVVITVNLTVSGSYLIVVTSAFPDETGAFTLELAPGSRITPGSPASVWNPA